MSSRPPRRRRPTRLPRHVCDGGWHFVTVCTRDRAERFGAVVEGTMCLSEAGGDVIATWLDLPAYYPNVELDVCVVMPDHVHAVLGLPGGSQLRRHGLCEVVRAWKTFSAHRINVRSGTPGARVWQRSFYHHVVRGPGDLERIRRYVIENPARWTERHVRGGR